MTDADHFGQDKHTSVASLRTDRHQIGITDRHRRNRHIAPVTPIGRALAVVLMLSGLGLLSTLAGSISSYFVGSDTHREILAIHERLERMGRILEQMKDHESRTASNPNLAAAKSRQADFEAGGRPA